LETKHGIKYLYGSYPQLPDKIKRLILPGNDDIFCGDKKRGLTIDAPKKFNAVRTNYSSYK